MAAAPYRRTFGRLLGFLRPYKWSLVVSIVLAVLSQAAQFATAFLTGAALGSAVEGHDKHALKLIVAAVLAVGLARALFMVGAPPDLGTAGARRRVRPAQRALRAPAPALVRLLRPPPDGAADVARDGRPADRPLLPRLRAHLLLPERAHARRRGGRDVLRQLEADARRAVDRAAADRARVPLLARRAPAAARRAAEDGRRRDRRRGEHRRRPRRQVVRAGAAPSRRSSSAPRRPSSGRASRRTGSARSTCRCSRSCRCSRRRR